MKRIENLEELLSWNDTNGAIVSLDSFVEEISSHGDQMDNLTEPQKFFFYNQNLEKEINNGGFDQYFFNPTGEYAHETVRSLMEIGAHKTANILQRAINVFPNQNVPKDREKRVASMENLNEKVNEIWEELEQEFYAYEDDLNSLNLEFVRKNKDSF